MFIYLFTVKCYYSVRYSPFLHYCFFIWNNLRSYDNKRQYVTNYLHLPPHGFVVKQKIVPYELKRASIFAAWLSNRASKLR